MISDARSSHSLQNLGSSEFGQVSWYSFKIPSNYMACFSPSYVSDFLFSDWRECSIAYCVIMTEPAFLHGLQSAGRGWSVKWCSPIHCFRNDTFTTDNLSQGIFLLTVDLRFAGIIFIPLTRISSRDSHT